MLFGNGSKKISIVLVGLDGSGKTTILFNLRLREATNKFKSSEGFNFEKLDLKYQKAKYEMRLWDLAGSRSLRHKWFCFFESITPNAVIFVIDPSDVNRVPEAKRELHRVLYDPNLMESVKVLLINQRKDWTGKTRLDETELREVLNVPRFMKSVVVDGMNASELQFALYHICQKFEKR